MNSDALAYLAARGLTLEEVIEFARIAERKRDNTGAERQARHRAKRNAVTVTRDAPLDKEIPPIPPKEINPPLPPVISNEITIPPENSDDLTVDEVVQAWNDLAADLGLPAIAKLTPKRRRAANCRIREHPFEDWAAALAAIRRSRFLAGDNDRGWRANFNWLLQPETITKLLEGQYDDTAKAH